MHCLCTPLTVACMPVLLGSAVSSLSVVDGDNAAVADPCSDYSHRDCVYCIETSYDERGITYSRHIPCHEIAEYTFQDCIVAFVRRMEAVMRVLRTGHSMLILVPIEQIVWQSLFLPTGALAFRHVMIGEVCAWPAATPSPMSKI